jgi:hypothetical protein
MSKTIDARLTKLETVAPAADTASSPVLTYRPGETTEQAAERQGIDPKGVIFVIPDNGRDK